ncbi:hypothetical protein LEN26_014619 [Aphanomyces euteiches]|nr:hypothetical protein LEN26_014619 [Aphanomyces euteiches]KAH9182469.1 hypothetical protein AeNC1_015556 [Aphanomyces euteiches]
MEIHRGDQLSSLSRFHLENSTSGSRTTKHASGDRQFEPLDDDDKGRVVIYSRPTGVLTEVSDWIYNSIIEQIVAAGNNDIRLMRSVSSSGSTTFQVGDGLCFYAQEADNSLKPVNLRVGGQVLAGTATQDPFPTVVIEMAYKNQTFDHLLGKIRSWMHPQYTSVQVAIGIHISPVSGRRRAILHVRGQAVQVTEFGDDSAIVPLPLVFPMACIYWGVAWPNALSGHENDMISIDLIALRRFIRYCIDRH